MAKKIWEPYRTRLPREFRWRRISSDNIKLALKYMKMEIDAEELNKFITFKEEYIEKYREDYSFAKLDEMTTEQFAAFCVAQHCFSRSRHNAGERKPWPVVLLQNKKIIKDSTELILKGWHDIWKYVKAPEFEELHKKFHPTGTGRMRATEYYWYVLFSHYMAIALGELMSLDLLLADK